MPIDQDRRDHQRDDEGRKVESDLHPNRCGALTKSWARWTSSGDCAAMTVRHLVQKGLGAGAPASDRPPGPSGAPRCSRRCAERRPVVVGQPQRHLDVEECAELDEVVGPTGGHGAGAHGVFQRQVPADDPGEDLAQRGVSVRVGAARQWNHGRKLGVAQRRERAAQARRARTRASAPARRSERPGPESTKMPAPMMAPTPSAVSWNTGPACVSSYARRSLAPPRSGAQAAFSPRGQS